MSKEHIEKAQLLAWLESYRDELDADTIRSFEDLIGIERIRPMTFDEREAKTKEILSQWSTSVQCGDYDVIWKRLEAEIIKPAIEEDRKTRECCKAEREACAGIADGEDGLEWCACPEAPARIAEKIRARSDS